MKRYAAYLRYILRHKWYVFDACLALGVPLRLALFHDLSKFRPREFVPYARQFFGSDGKPVKVRDASGAYNPLAQPTAFLGAWLNHQRNKHHWQAWCVIGDAGRLSPLPMPEDYVREMVADWCGAGRAINGRVDVEEFWIANGTKMVLHRTTRALVAILVIEGQAYYAQRGLGRNPRWQAS